MIVYVYEKLSDGAAPLRRAVGARATTTSPAFTSAGYFEFEPDIVFRPREPGLSVVECVRPARRRRGGRWASSIRRRSA